MLHFHSTVINYAERLDEEIIQHFKHSRSQETAKDAQQSPSSTHPAPRRGTRVTRGFAPPGALLQAPRCLLSSTQLLTAPWGPSSGAQTRKKPTMASLLPRGEAEPRLAPWCRAQLSTLCPNPSQIRVLFPVTPNLASSERKRLQTSFLFRAGHILNANLGGN